MRFGISCIGLGAATLALLILGAGIPAIAAPAAPPIAPGTARIWVYCTFEPSISRGFAKVAIDGSAMLLSPNGGATYCDVPGGRSQILAEIAAAANKAKAVTLAPGEVVFAKLVPEDDWMGAGQGMHRVMYDVKLEPAVQGRAEMSHWR